MPAKVQLWIYGVGDIVVQRWDTDSCDVLRESLRRVCTSYKRGCGRLRQLPGERLDVPADVQLGVHGVGDIIVQRWDTDRRDVLEDTVLNESARQG